MERFKNFDDFINERTNRNVYFQVFGKTYELAPTLPYQAVLEFKRLAKRSKDTNLTDDDIFRIFESVVGTDIRQELSKNPRFDMELALSILNHLMSEYGLSSGTAEKKG